MGLGAGDLGLAVWSFTALTLIDYFKYQNPIVVYSKDNDQETNRKINLKDSFLLFQLVDVSNFMKINSSITYYDRKVIYKVMYDNGSYDDAFLEIDNCEVGKNIDIKYKDYLDNKYKFNRSISDYYCINFKGKNLPLFYLPNIGYSYLVINILKNNQIEFPTERIQSLIVSENDLIDHYNKKKPISQNHIYHFSSSFSSKEFTNIMYNFQYIKYQSDEGLFYENSKELDGMSFSDMSFYKSIKQGDGLNNDNDNNHDSMIGTLTIAINKSHFDNYKRSYKKIQSLLAEIMSVISLLFQIGAQICIFLCKKKMSKDIIFNLINNNIYRNRRMKLSLPNKKINALNTEHKNNERGINNSSSKNINNLNIEKSSELKLNREKINKKSYIINREENNNQNYISEVNKNINYLHIIKSFFCFNDKKTKLIDLCHNIIIEDTSIERILERFYNLEKEYYFIIHKKYKKFFSENEKLKEIRKYIDKIYHKEIYQKQKKIIQK